MEQDKSLFSYKSFLSLVITTLFTSHGFQIQFVALSWQIYNVTKDPLSLGFVGLAEAASFLSVCLFGGYIADRFHRKNLALLALSGQIACGLLYLYFTLKNENLSTHIVNIFYVITFIKGIFRGLYQPSVNALIPDIVPKKLLPQAAAFRVSAWQLSMIIGPSIGGLFIAWQGLVATYFLSTLLISGGVIVLSFVKYEHHKGTSNRIPMIQSLKEGVSFVFNHRIILPAISLDLFAVLFGGVIALLPIYASDILKVGPQGLGYLRAAPGLGALLMSIVCTRYPVTNKVGPKILISVFLFGFSMLGFGISNSFFFCLLFLFLSGAFDTVSVIIRSTIIQTYTPKELMGRVLSVNLVFIGSSNELGAFESGITAKYFGVVPSVIVGSILTILVTTYIGINYKELRQLDQIKTT